MNLTTMKAPNTFLIIFTLLVIVAGGTWIIPAGHYDRKEVKGKEVVDPDTFQYVESNPQDIGDILVAPIKGFVNAADIIGFVLIVGGAFAVFQRTKAVDAAIMALTRAHKRSNLIRMLLIPIMMTLFSLGGATFGMSEETIPFILIFVPLALALGYDSFVGVAIPFVGAGAGFAGAFFNPFTVGIAQGIADLPIFSGLEYRLLVWLLTTSTAITFVMIYAARIKKDPRKSHSYEIDQQKKQSMDLNNIDQFDGMTQMHKSVLAVFTLGMAVLVFGVLKYGWYIEEITGVFFATGILVGLVGRLGHREITEAFIDGAKTLMSTALIIAIARAVLIISQDGLIIDTILKALSSVVGSAHPVVASQIMFLIQSVLNFFVPSGSGQAALTMPVMAPLADLVGVTRQTAVLAFQFGDGFTNLIVPTSAILMGVLSLADIPWNRWLRWMLPLQLIFVALGLLLLIPPYLIAWK